MSPFRSGGAAAAAAAAMAAATNKFLQQHSQQQHQVSNEGNTSAIASPPSPSPLGSSSMRAVSIESDKSNSAGQPLTTPPSSSLDSCIVDEQTYPTKTTPTEANGSITHDIESNCSTANSND